MNFVTPKEDTLSVVNDGNTYTNPYYQIPTLLTGVTDEAHPNYDSATTYAIDDYCIIPGLKAIYKSSEDANLNKYPPKSPNSWTYWSPINSYNMLAVDEAIGSTTDGVDTVIEFDFSNLTALTLINCTFQSLLIEQIDNTTATTISSEVVNGTDFAVASYHDYFYLPFENITRIHRNLAWYADSTLRLTFTGAASIGVVTVGLEEEMGCTMYGTSLEIEDSSTITKSPVTGFRKVHRYGNVRVVQVKLLFNISDFGDTTKKVERIIGKNTVFIPTDKDELNEMITIGYMENFKMPIAYQPVFETQTTIIGVV